MTFPWEQLPAVVELPVAETVAALQRDIAYMVTHTAVLVHSEHSELCTLVNTPRGQIIPRGECKFTDGSKFELRDIGMPQVGAPTMTINELMAHLWVTANLALGLELQL